MTSDSNLGRAARREIKIPPAQAGGIDFSGQYPVSGGRRVPDDPSPATNGWNLSGSSLGNRIRGSGLADTSDIRESNDGDRFATSTGLRLSQ